MPSSCPMNVLKALFGTLLSHTPSSTLKIARAALGKYIIAFACALHVVWAAVICIDIRGVNATPLSIIYVLCQHDRVFTVAVLLFVSLLAMGFLDIRLRAKLSMSSLSLFLIPQQIVLWCSAFNGIYCTLMQRYADGTVMSWPHIAVDQAPIVMTALLYTVALLESRHPPEVSELLMAHGVKIMRGPQGERGFRGDQGEQGAPGAPGAPGIGGTGGRGGRGGKGGDAPAELGAPGSEGEAGK